MDKKLTINFPFSIRVKVVFPYLILTMAVAIVGAYVVTKLVANSLSERLTNQLLEAGRVVSDTVVKKEINHLEIARIVAYTQGLAEALAAGETEVVSDLATPVAISLGIENLIIIDSAGTEAVHLMLQTNNETIRLDQDTGANGLSIVDAVLANPKPNQPARRAIGLHPINNSYYYFTSVPVYQNDVLVGVVIVGTSLDSIIPDLKNTALADIILYQHGGEAIDTSLASPGGDQELLLELSIPSSTFDEIILNSTAVTGTNISVYGRQYRLAWSPLKVGNERIGVFAVALPLNFVLQAGTTSRNTYAFLFTLAMVGVIMTGFSVARIITRPLNSLLQTSQAIAGGNLKQRTGIRGRDEIGLLAENFDVMTDNLEARTHELEVAYQALSKMDKNKVSFINVSAHELRTPLTLIKGYTQMLNDKSKHDPNLEALSQGILNGTNRMLDIVNSMLDVSRIDSQTLKLVPEKIEFDAIIERVHQEFLIALDERRLEFISIGFEKLPLVMADPDQIYKVIYHLVMNAIKYTPDGGKITASGTYIQNSVGEDEIEIVISDTGIGIDLEEQELIFEKFYQTGEVMFHSSGKTKFKGGGPGLGLAIARGIVLAHGGKLTVYSPGHDEEKCPGSNFIIRLPVNGP